MSSFYNTRSQARLVSGVRLWLGYSVVWTVTRNHREARIADINDAINTRDFALESPAWKIVDAQVFGSIGAAFHATNVIPEMRSRLSNVSTELSESLDRAVVEYNVDISGAPPGIVSQRVGCAEYQLNEQGQWLRVKHQGMSLQSDFAFPRTPLTGCDHRLKRRSEKTDISINSHPLRRGL
ncbi:hypothetical protein AC579_4492 [Pseudocercospora musae]|uniref:SnoaL-like domain-containing protein n=1 Tax=Pseudocercospora musae TaxID=113226 RepID=A0A139I6B2_9PEZI|nr:hypothetical protein AC579_4492 [Pseudocercospora musae]